MRVASGAQCAGSVARRAASLPFTPSALPPSCARSSRPTAAPRSVAASASSLGAHPVSRRTATATALLHTACTSALLAAPAAAAPTPRGMATSATASGSGPVAGSPSNVDLLVVGPGVLGSVLAKDWLASVPGSTATGLTNTERSHARLTSMGIVPATRASLPADRKWSFVAFAAPPSGSADYVADIRAALALWDGTGSFLFTSSMSVCAVDDGGAVSDERCPLVAVGAGPSTDKLLGAEAAVLEGGGNVLRLVGLYHAERGAHTFFIKQGSVARPPGYVVNLLHYEDAAGLGAAVLRGDGSGPFRGRVFIGADGHPITFGDMVEACFSSGTFPRVPVAFTGAFPEGGRGRGKAVDNSGTRAALGGWAPKYDSFAAFMAAGGKDLYNSS